MCGKLHTKLIMATNKEGLKLLWIGCWGRKTLEHHSVADERMFFLPTEITKERLHILIAALLISSMPQNTN